MNRTTFGYLVMILGSAGLLWAILHLGSRLNAPPAWSGTWNVGETSHPTTATIQQSGVFLVVQFEHQLAKPYKIVAGGNPSTLLGENDSLLVTADTFGRYAQLTLLDPVKPGRTIRLWREVADAPSR